MEWGGGVFIQTLPGNATGICENSWVLTVQDPVLGCWGG